MEFQKNLVVWKPRKYREKNRENRTVSEELSSVETKWSFADIILWIEVSEELSSVETSLLSIAKIPYLLVSEELSSVETYKTD